MTPQELERVQGVVLDQPVDHRSIMVALTVFLFDDAPLNDAICQLVHVLLEEHERSVEVLRVLKAVLGSETLLHLDKLRCQACG